LRSGETPLLFVKAAKVISLSITFLPLTGCAIATGLVFSALVRGIAYSPEQEDVLFNYTTLGFAFIESFAFMLFLVAAIILSF
jgi:F0F1-type ATP synthase membrane subunit c/vacuolar-type H+-ATPase subunit K